jgi:5-phospho-D-xylono-1,4-lactonase
LYENSTGKNMMDSKLRRPDQVMTVSGPLDSSALGVTDAHQHVWIAPVAGGPAGTPLLCDRDVITAGLAAYRAAGGGSLLDCQPGGCGRDGRALAGLSRLTGVPIIACTGFHLARYYPPDFWLWGATAEAAADYFMAEIVAGLVETRGANQNLSENSTTGPEPVEGPPLRQAQGACGENSWTDSQPIRAGFIKIAIPAEPAEIPAALWEAAASASRDTGSALLAHTEAGAAAEQVVTRLLAHGAAADRLVICHIDKRPDFGLHRELAQAGIVLEYDTFFRPKYDPERNVWPLLQRMAAAGLAEQVAIGTDMAGTAFWQEIGPAALPGEIVSRLGTLGFESSIIRRLTGGNIADRLAGIAASSTAS